MDIMYIDGDLLLKMFKQGTFELNSNKGLVDSLNVSQFLMVTQVQICP